MPDQDPHRLTSAAALAGPAGACGVAPPTSAATAATTSAGSISVQARVPGDRADARPAARAGRVLAAEHDRGYPVRRPPGGRDHRGEQADHRRAHRGGQVGRAGVRRDHHVGARPARRPASAGWSGRPGPPGRALAAGGGRPADRPRVSADLGGRPGHHHPVSGRGQRGRDRPPSSPGKAARAGHGRAGVQDHVGAAAGQRPAVRQAGRDGQRAGVPRRQLETRRPDQGEVPLGLRNVSGRGMPDVEQRSRVVLADRGDPRHARHPQGQRRRQRRLVEGGEHHSWRRQICRIARTSRSATARVEGARLGIDPGPAHPRTRFTPGSSAAADAPRGPARKVTGRPLAASARTAGPVSSTSPMPSGRTASTRRGHRGRPGHRGRR